MDKRQLTTPYPDPESIAGTLRKHSTLHASRRFFASEGVLVYANTIDGMMNAAAEVWLRPGAQRRLGEYLDLKLAPSIVGYQIVRQGLQLEGTVPKEMFDEFTGVAAALENDTLEPAKRKITLCGISDSGVDGWPWHGTLVYRHVFALENGQRIYSNVHVPMLVRPNGENALDVAFVIWRKSDQEAALFWLRSLTNPTHGAAQPGWMPETIKLSDDAEKRLAEIERIFTTLGGGTLVGLRNPDMKGSGGKSGRTSFSGILDTARYETNVTTIDLIEERMSHDEGIVAGLDGFTLVADMPISEKGEKYHPIICLRLHQPHIAGVPVALTWKSGKRISTNTLPITGFNTEVWDNLRSVEWTDADKWRFLARSFAHLLDAHRGHGQAGSVTAATA